SKRGRRIRVFGKIAKSGVRMVAIEWRRKYRCPIFARSTSDYALLNRSFIQVNLGSLTGQTGLRLNRRFRSAQAFTVEPKPVEAARVSLPGSEHSAGIRENDETRSPKSKSSPNPISASDRRDLRAQHPRKEPEIFSLRPSRIRGLKQERI